MAIDPQSLAASPLFVDASDRNERGLLDQISSESFLVSTGVESNGFIPCGAAVSRIDGGLSTVTLDGHFSASYSATHDLVAALRIGSYYTEGQCVGSSLVILNTNLETLYEVDLSADDGVPPAFKSVTWMESGELLVVIDQKFDLLDEYAPWRSDLLVYAMTSDGPERTAILRPAVDEVWTGVFASGADVIVVSSSQTKSVVRRIEFDALAAAFSDESDWGSIGSPRALEGFVFSAVGLADGEMLVSILGEGIDQDVTVSTATGAMVANGVSGLDRGRR